MPILFPEADRKRRSHCVKPESDGGVRDSGDTKPSRYFAQQTRDDLSLSMFMIVGFLLMACMVMLMRRGAVRFMFMAMG